jgi:N-acetyl-gamma-glutamyl-phosphate reductase
MPDKLRAQLIGATGYGGLGALELLLAHPNFDVSALVARDDAGRRIDEVYPHLAGRCDMPVQSADSVTVGADCDVVIFATPDGVSQAYARDLVARGIRFIDYSGDFRFTSSDDYARYAARHPSIANAAHKASDLLGKNSYGISELNAEAIGAAPVVGNPGCFAVGIILGLAPLYAAGLVEDGRAQVNGLTGASGAGKKPSPVQHFSHLNDNVVPYRVLNHQHVVEAELTLGRLGRASGATVDFIPHLLGTTRGILNTMHVRLTQSMSRPALLAHYRAYFNGQPFVRILDTPPTLKGPLGSNYCDITAFVAEDERHAVLISAIDNLLKGQSGSAVQNLNLMFGLPQTAGLDRGPFYP